MSDYPRIRKLAMCATITAVMLAAQAGGLAYAQHWAPSRADFAQVASMLELGDLEATFWRCDYRAAKFGVHATPYGLCGAVTEALKVRKFGGRSEKLVEWWRHNREAQYDMLARSADEASPRTVGQR